MENLPPHIIRLVYKEVTTLTADPPDGIKVFPNEEDLTDLQVTIEGPGEFGRKEGRGCCLDPPSPHREVPVTGWPCVRCWGCSRGQGRTPQMTMKYFFPVRVEKYLVSELVYHGTVL